jgi:peptide/nickel transport system permease protein
VKSGEPNVAATSGGDGTASSALRAADGEERSPRPAGGTLAEQRIAVATQWQLMWWRFRKHKLAVSGTLVLLGFYLVAVFANFFAYADPQESDAQRSLMAPQPIHWFDEGRFRPFVYALKGTRDPTTFKRVYAVDTSKKIPVVFFGKGEPWKLFGIIPTDRHLLATEGAIAGASLFLMGTDTQGRDLWSRLTYATRTSMTIGLVSVALSLVLGVVLGGVSGYFGGIVDTVIQRIIEILRSIPTIPLWMGLAAALPSDWSVIQIYFAITIIISLIGWTELARVVRGRFISLKEEDFVMAAELLGCSKTRIIFRHMVPSFVSHIIAATTLAIPAIIISETSLSFLGLGLRPPAISWGVLLQDAQDIQALVISPWLLIPAIPVTIAVLAFNFMGDGIRDAADPYL